MTGLDLVDRLVQLALEEDLSKGDVTTMTTVADTVQGQGLILAKQDLVVAGLDVANRVFSAVDASIQVDWVCKDGDFVTAGTPLGNAHGSVPALLAAERTVLNFMQRLCGVATTTRTFLQAVSGLPVAIVDTRKTTPGWRTLEKMAVAAGGGTNHRFCLGSGILIKDNHVDAGGGVVSVVQKARAGAPSDLLVQVEVRTLAELDSAIEARADMVLLDNMTNETMREAADRARAAGIVTEASGGVTLLTVRGIAETGVDRISIGALTHSAPSMDISMKVKPL